MRRRKFIAAVGTGAVVSVAGCSGGGDDDGGNGNGNGNTDTETGNGTGNSATGNRNDGNGNGNGESGNGNGNGTGTRTSDGDDTLVVGTYSAFLDAPSISPGEWLKQEFESEFDARLVWQSPPNEINHYIERRNAGVDIDADVYVGLNTDELVRIDEKLDDQLFQKAGDVEGLENVKPGLEFDPEGRAVPYDTGYICLVYDGTETEAPETFDGLLADEHSGDLIAQNPSTATTGRAFLLHTVHHYGEDGYLDFWSDLQENDVQVLGSWSDAYNAWLGDEAPMVVSYSTDQVFAAQDDANLEEHRIRFLNDQGYANPEGMALFESASSPELAREFMGFMLRPDIQGEIAQRNVQFPATNNANLPAEYDELAFEPPDPVTFTYDQLQGSISEWIEDWERQFIGG